MIPPGASPRLSKKARLRWDPREQKYLLLYPERGLLLNEAAYAIVALCDGEHDPTRIADLLALRLGIVDHAAVRREVSAFLERLDERGLLEAAPPAGS
jgi:coenzyme PQQ biosynthesis protein PqqD